MPRSTVATDNFLSLFDVVSFVETGTLIVPERPTIVSPLGLLDLTSPLTTQNENKNNIAIQSAIVERIIVATPPMLSHVLNGDRNLATGWKQRALDNLAAIRVMKRLTADGQYANADELEVLSKFVGFGAGEIATSIFPLPGESVRDGWQAVYDLMHSLLQSNEIAALSRSTQYAHYTPEFIGRTLWKAVSGLGFAGGEILEPGCGSGLMFSIAPAAIVAISHFTGVEMDPTTAGIARLLHPHARIINNDFSKTRLPDAFSLAIGNPPYSQTQVYGEGRCSKRGFRLHDYFISRSIELLQPNGLAAFVTSHGTLDKINAEAREYIGSMANLIGAVRLPQKAMNAAAGTEVVVDILLFRKRTDERSNIDSWLGTVNVDGHSEPMHINRYFANNPSYVLGDHSIVTSQYGPKYSCIRKDQSRLATDLETAIDTIVDAAPRVAMVGYVSANGTVEFPPNNLKDGSYYERSGILFQVNNSRGYKVSIRTKITTGVPKNQAAIISYFIPVRDALRAVLTAQEADAPYEDEQAALRSAYKRYTAALGPINLTIKKSLGFIEQSATTKDTSDDDESTDESADNDEIETVDETDDDTSDADDTTEPRLVERIRVRRPNLTPILDDPDCWLVASIERYDEETGIATMGPIFSERVLRPLPVAKIETIGDALALCLDKLGKLDIEFIAQTMNIDRTTAITDLGERIYRVPAIESEEWQTDDHYLSGNVRKKLKIAQLAAAENEIYQRNVDALTKALPIDLTPSEVTVRLGMPWLDPNDISLFCKDVIGVETVISHNAKFATWDIRVRDFENKPQATSEWGTGRRHAGHLLHDAVHNRTPKITDLDDDKKVIVNAVETEAAKEKMKKIQDAFSAWVWMDFDRSQRLIRIYNDTYNDLVPRTFDGSHLRLPGTAGNFKFYTHQKRAIWRGIAAGSMYIAHVVGAGKTYEIAAICMEQKRIGLISKPMLVVPRHCLAQTSREFLQLYPMANILVADEANFAKAKRQRFIARATTEQWDCIIITDSAFKLIPSPTKFEQELVDEQMQEIEIVLSNKALDRTTRKRVEQMKEAFAKRTEKLSSRKDNMVTISEIGIDQIIFDEAQRYRKLAFMTNASAIKGIDPMGSQCAWDAYIKSRFTETIRPGRGLIMASGTPITNTLGELFTLQRFLGAQALAEKNIHEFDAWAAMFGETVTELELQPSGNYRPVTRFAQFMNLPELISEFRTFADIVSKDDLRSQIKLPTIETGGRQLITSAASPEFKAYQKLLAERIYAIEHRSGQPHKGDDIILSVITDGRHAAIDLRLVDRKATNDPNSKLNLCIDKIYDIWEKTKDKMYHLADGSLSFVPGAVQMIFSDLGTPAVAAKRGFSAYNWIRQSLIERGVPANQIEFMQDHKKTSEKQDLFNAVNTGKVRIMLGSSETMGTGVNCQRRMIALHHLDVPWLPKDVEQREGRIERQGNENDVIQTFAYATLGSMDAPMWGTLQRKQRFITAALSGDKSLRRIEDVGSQAGQFAMAKAIASGNPLLMQKSGLEAEIARLLRLQAAHRDDQHRLASTVYDANANIHRETQDIAGYETDISRRIDTSGDAFEITVGKSSYTDRRRAGALLIGKMNQAAMESTTDAIKIGEISSFPIVAVGNKNYYTNAIDPEIGLYLTNGIRWIQSKNEPVTDIGLVARLENILKQIETKLRQAKADVTRLSEKKKQAEALLGVPFPSSAELATKQAELTEIENELVAQSVANEAEIRAEKQAAEAEKTRLADEAKKQLSEDDVPDTNGNANVAA